MKDFGEMFLIILGVIFVVVLVSFLYGAILMWLWNAVIVIVFAAPTLTYWQACGICIICNLLFKSTNTSTKKE